MLRLPMAALAQDTGASRSLEQRTVHEAAATVILGAILLVAIRLMAEWFKRLGDNRAAFLASGVERDFILRTFRHVIRLPLSFLRPAPAERSHARSTNRTTWPPFSLRQRRICGRMCSG
jgi:hypothetical protein